MSAIHLVEGPVGAGKSTYAAKLAERIGGSHIALDQWFAHLFSPDRPVTEVAAWYLERKHRLVGLIWQHAQSLAASGATPILELGLIRRADREEIYGRASAVAAELVVHVLDAPRDVRRERVHRRNEQRGSTFSMVVPDHVFELASDMWEPPDDSEFAEHRILLVPSTIGT